MQFSVLGPLTVSDDTGAFAIGGPKQRAVLARLLLVPNAVVSDDVLIDTVWPNQHPDRAKNTLQVYVTNLRRLLEAHDRKSTSAHGRLLRRSGGYVLQAAPDEVDLERFRGLVAEGRALLSDNPARAAERLRSALALWRGPAFSDLAVDTTALPEVIALEEERLTVLEECLQAELNAGRGGDLIPELEQLTLAHPLRERLHEQLMVALYRGGRQAEALKAYQAARGVLREELGIDPGPQLRRLHDAVLQQDRALHAVIPSRREHLPLPGAAHPLIGRRRELAELERLLSDPTVRLVTVLGTGGTGKTRIALEVAHHAQGQFPGGVTWVPLAPISDAQLLLASIQAALGVKEVADRTPLQLLQDRLDGQQTLLVLDNFEQLLPAAAQVSELLGSCDSITVLTTSRAALRIAYEHEYPVDPLPLVPTAPPPSFEELSGNEAVRLFGQRARTVLPSFQLTRDNAWAVAAICERVDGLPLAIELAAARTRAMSPSDIMDRLDARLSLLTGGPADLPERQRTLRATLGWSVGLLDERHQQLFARLSTFRGGWTLSAAEAVCPDSGGDRTDVLDALEVLLSHSLALRRPTGRDSVRFYMLETVREYAHGLLERSPALHGVRDRHARFYMHLAETARDELEGPHQVRRIEALAIEQDNFRAAMDWCLADKGPRSTGVRLANALGHFWEVTGALREGRQWLSRAVDAAALVPPDLVMRAYSALGTLAWAAGDYDDAAHLHSTALRISRQVGDQALEAFSLNNLGAIGVDQGDHATAELLCRQAAELASRIGALRIAGMAIHNRGEIALHRKDYSAAADCYTHALSAFRQLGDQWLMTATLRSAAVAALRVGKRGEAVRILIESLGLAHELGENSWVASDLESLAAVAQQSARPSEATRLLAMAAALRDRIGAPVQTAEQPERDALEDALKAELGEEKFHEAWTDAQTLTVHQAVSEALRLPFDEE